MRFNKVNREFRRKLTGGNGGTHIHAGTSRPEWLLVECLDSIAVGVTDMVLISVLLSADVPQTLKYHDMHGTKETLQNSDFCC